MRKIGIITFHREKNYGAVLQTYALARTLNELGACCEVVDFWTTYLRHSNRIFRVEGETLKKCIDCFKHCVLYMNETRQRRERFRQFVEKYVPLSEPVTENSIANFCANQYGALIAGSDQVFNAFYTRKDLKNYLLAFAPETVDRYSYAASIGAHIDLITDEEKALYKRELTKFKDLSIREHNGVDFVKELTQRDAHLHLDPTLLIRMEQWKEICEEPANKSPYILMYLIFNATAAYEYAKKLSVEMGLPVICILGCASGVEKTGYSEFQYLRDCSPEQFLGLMRGAAYVVTSSFHGTVFSILFRRKFVAFPSKKNKSDDRIQTLLRLTGLSQRLWSDTFQETENINWEYAESQLDLERDKAKEYLGSIIRETRGE